MIRSNLTATQRERHKTALYAVWADMLKRARKEYNMFQKYKIPRDFPVDSSFREFAGFMLWARLEQGYVIGRDDAKQICRADTTGRLFRRSGGPESRCKEVEIMSIKLIVGFIIGRCLMELARR